MTQPGVPRFLAASTAAQQFAPVDGLGQQVASFRYEVSDGITGLRIGEVTPLRTTIPVIVHNTQNTIVRTLTGFNLGKADTAAMNPITDRISPFMVVRNVDGSTSEYPLGRYMYNATNKQVLSGGDLAQNSLFDEMFIVDQQIPYSFGLAEEGLVVTSSMLIARLLDPLVDAGLIEYTLEGGNAVASGAWPPGTSRAKILADICAQAGYFRPWFDNAGVMRIISAFNPARRDPDFDFDDSNVVFRDSISYTNDFLDAPNLYIAINTSGTTEDGESYSSVGRYEVPAAAPWSIANRGFIIPQVTDMQSSSQANMNAIAAGIAEQDTVFERTQMSTMADPRHDGYDVVRWQDQQWLELAYSIQMQAGAPTIRTLRKAYG